MMLLKCLLLLLLCLYPLTDSFAVGQIEVHPGLRLGREYTDNLFLTATDVQSDWITTVEPGLILKYNAPSVNMALDYSLRYRFYQKNSEQNLDQFVDVQRTNSSALFFEGRPFNLLLNGSISRESLDVRDTSAASNELVNMSTVYHLTVAPQYRWRYSGTFSIVFGYLYDRIEVVDTARDSEGQSGSVSLEKQLSTNTLVASSYHYLQQQSDVDDFYTQQDYVFGLTQQFGPHLSAHAEAGMSLVRYDTGQDDTSPNWLAGVTYQVSTPLSLKLDFAQRYQYLPADGLNKNRVATASINYGSTRIVGRGELYGDEAEYVQTNRKDQAFGARFNLHLVLTKVIFGEIDADAERANFKPDDEQVDRYGLGGAVGIKYRKLTVTGSYHYRYANSDIETNDYKNNIFALNAILRF